LSKNLVAILFITLICGLCSCGSTNIAGTYRTNFADLGFFATTITLKTDSTLEYVFQGDLIYDSATGHYSIYNQNVYITFDREFPDTNKLYYRFKNVPLKNDTILVDIICYQEFYYIGHDKLFAAHSQTGKKVTKARRYNKRKQYILFGSQYYKKRWYLKRID